MYYIRVSTCTDVAFYNPHPLFSLLSLSFRQRPPRPPWECDCSHSLLCCITFAEKMRKSCADTVGHLTVCPQKCPPAQRFDMQATDQRSPIQVLTQLQAFFLNIYFFHSSTVLELRVEINIRKWRPRYVFI